MGIAAAGGRPRTVQNRRGPAVLNQIEGARLRYAQGAADLVKVEGHIVRRVVEDQRVRDHHLVIRHTVELEITNGPRIQRQRAHGERSHTAVARGKDGAALDLHRTADGAVAAQRRTADQRGVARVGVGSIQIQHPARSRALNQQSTGAIVADGTGINDAVPVQVNRVGARTNRDSSRPDGGQIK